MKSYHFIAIGGIGMSGLAKYLLELGYCVSGSDINSGKYTKELESLGAKVYIGHDGANVPQDAIVVVSSAIKQDNPELVKAKELGLTIYHRSDLLKEISEKTNCFIGFAGCHGKTTTSGMASFVLEKSNLKPSYVVGGLIPEFHTNAKYVDDSVFVAELDESDGTIQKYLPDVCVINNLDVDHVDFYTDGINSMVSVFNNFISKLKPEAKVLINNDCEYNLRLVGKDFITYGLNNADYVAKNIVISAGFSSFDIYYKGEFLTDLKTKMVGEYNVYNALAVFVALKEAGFEFNKYKNAFLEFSGMGRRFELVGEINGALLYDDYAHHPTEVKSLLNSLSAFKDRNLVVVFQPHRYTRLQKFWDKFVEALKPVKNIIVTDVFAASEDEIDGINSAEFVKNLNDNGLSARHFSGPMEDVAKKFYPEITSKDVIICIGAGSINKLAPELLKLNKEICVES